MKAKWRKYFCIIILVVSMLRSYGGLLFFLNFLYFFQIFIMDWFSSKVRTLDFSQAFGICRVWLSLSWCPGRAMVCPPSGDIEAPGSWQTRTHECSTLNLPAQLWTQLRKPQLETWALLSPLSSLVLWCPTKIYACHFCLSQFRFMVPLHHSGWRNEAKCELMEKNKVDEFI